MNTAMQMPMQPMMNGMMPMPGMMPMMMNGMMPMMGGMPMMGMGGMMPMMNGMMPGMGMMPMPMMMCQMKCRMTANGMVCEMMPMEGMSSEAFMAMCQRMMDMMKGGMPMMMACGGMMMMGTMAA